MDDEGGAAPVRHGEDLGGAGATLTGQHLPARQVAGQVLGDQRDRGLQQRGIDTLADAGMLPRHEGPQHAVGGE